VPSFGMWQPDAVVPHLTDVLFLGCSISGWKERGPKRGIVHFGRGRLTRCPEAFDPIGDRLEHTKESLSRKYRIKETLARLNTPRWGIASYFSLGRVVDQIRVASSGPSDRLSPPNRGAASVCNPRFIWRKYRRKM
jgi:hypothetical protein